MRGRVNASVSIGQPYSNHLRSPWPRHGLENRYEQHVLYFEPHFDPRLMIRAVDGRPAPG